MSRAFFATTAAATTLAAASTLMAGSASAQDAAPGPGLELLYTSHVTLGEAIQVGQTARGMRRIIPITGGTFDGPNIRGEILPMGWDWQLDRADGCTELVANYFLRTDDGVIINVINTGTICRPTDGTAPVIRTSPVFEAPLGRYEWLGQRGNIGTLGFDPAFTGPHVMITVYRAN